MAETTVGESRDEAGNVTARVPLRDGRPDGLAELFDAAGRRVRTAPFRAGVLEGELVEEAADGSRLRFNFKAGVLDGPARVEQGGRTLVAMAFKAGALDGPFAVFDAASGQPLYEARYAEGLLEGPATVYGPGGVKLRESVHRRGLLDGEVVDYAPDGAVTARTPYRAGVPVGEATAGPVEAGAADEELWFRRWARTPPRPR